MAERIMMTPDELNEGAAHLRRKLEAINAEVSDLKAKVDDVVSRWEGASQQSFVNQFEGEMVPILRDTLPQVIEGMAMGLDEAANAIRSTDESLASAFSG